MTPMVRHWPISTLAWRWASIRSTQASLGSAAVRTRRGPLATLPRRMWFSCLRGWTSRRALTSTRWSTPVPSSPRCWDARRCREPVRHYWPSASHEWIGPGWNGLARPIATCEHVPLDGYKDLDLTIPQLDRSLRRARCYEAQGRHRRALERGRSIRGPLWQGCRKRRDQRVRQSFASKISRFRLYSDRITRSLPCHRTSLEKTAWRRYCTYC